MERIKVLLSEDNPPAAEFIEPMVAEAKDCSFDVEWKEKLAIRAVRTGAQDYLIKKHVNSSLLIRTIRYAIARRMGGERRFTIQELKEYDGKEGKPAYMAFNGRVYDVSNSPIWEN